jgi:hypothetical protein
MMKSSIVRCDDLGRHALWTPGTSMNANIMAALTAPLQYSTETETDYLASLSYIEMSFVIFT